MKVSYFAQTKLTRAMTTSTKIAVHDIKKKISSNSQKPSASHHIVSYIV